MTNFLSGPKVSISRIEIFKTGTWHDRLFKDEDMQNMANNFLALKGTLVPKLKITHRADQESLAGLASYGDIVNIFAEKINDVTRLFADIDHVPVEVADWIKDKRFSERSIELFFHFKHNDKDFKDVIFAVALLGHEIPAVAGMAPVQLSKEDNVLNKKELVGVAFDIDDESSKFEIKLEEVKSNKKGGDSMEIKEIVEKLNRIEDSISNIVKMKEEEEAKFAKEADDKAKVEMKGKIESYEKQITDFKTIKEDYEKMKTSLDEAKKKNEELTLKNREGVVDAFVSSLKNDGKLIPAFEEEAKALLMSLETEEKVGTFSITDKDGKEAKAELSKFEAFKNLLSKIPKLVKFGESTFNSEGNGGDDIVDKEITVAGKTHSVSNTGLEDATQAYMKENKEVSYQDALIKISAKFKKEGKAQGLSSEE